MNKNLTILVEYENLMRARRITGVNDSRRDSLINEIRREVAAEYGANVDDKIARWIDVTRVSMWKDAAAVRAYIQAKMIYRDGFYEATIMASRSVCEMVCYEVLDDVPNPFGSQDEVERVSFRRLVKFLHENGHVPQRTFVLLNALYDLGNNYVHPKRRHDPKKDAQIALLTLGEALWFMYGASPDDIKAGVVFQTAYSTFPDICSSYNFFLDGFSSPEAALRGEFFLPDDGSKN